MFTSVIIASDCYMIFKSWYLPHFKMIPLLMDTLICLFIHSTNWPHNYSSGTVLGAGYIAVTKMDKFLPFLNLLILRKERDNKWNEYV